MSTVSGWYGFTYDYSYWWGWWTNTGNAKTDNTSYAYKQQLAGYRTWMAFGGWKGPTIPTGSTIDDLELRLRGYVPTSATYDPATATQRWMFSCFDTHGGAYSMTDEVYSASAPAETTATNASRNGDASYWGYTDADLVAYLNQSSGNEFHYGINVPSGESTEYYRIEYVEAQVTYTAPPGNAGMLIGNPGA